MDFCLDLTNIAKSVLDHFDLGYFDLTDNRRIVERWINVSLKMIKPEPRQVMKSQKLQLAKFDPEIASVLKIIEEKVKKGDDINPHLSKSIFLEDFTDYLFSDWGIYHLHLNTNLDGKYFVKRSDQLLFVTIDKGIIYFIDVRPHNEKYVFAQKELLNIIHENWPDLIEKFRLQGVVGLSYEIDDPDKIQKMRKSGVNVPQKVGGAVYAPMGGGITTAATSAQVTIQTNKLHRMVEKATEWVKEKEADILKIIMEETGKTKHELDLHIELIEQRFYVVDRNSSVCLPGDLLTAFGEKKKIRK